MLDLCLQDGNVRLFFLPLSLHRRDLFAQKVYFQRLLVQLQGHLLGLMIERIQFVVRLLENEGGGIVVLLRLFRALGDLLEAIQPDGNFQAPQFIAERQILFRLLRLLAKGLDLQFQLRDFVSDAKQIVLRVRKPALGLLLTMAVFGDTGSLFKNFAAVGRFLREDLVDSALADVGVTFSSKAGIHEKLVDIAQTRRLLVDVVLAFARTVVPAGDHDLWRFDGKRPVLIV